MAAENQSEILLRNISERNFHEVEGFGKVLISTWPKDIGTGVSETLSFLAMFTNILTPKVNRPSKIVFTNILPKVTKALLKPVLEYLNIELITPYAPAQLALWEKGADLQKILRAFRDFNTKINIGESTTDPKLRFIEFLKKTRGVDLLINACWQGNSGEAEQLMAEGINPNCVGYVHSTTNAVDKFVDLVTLSANQVGPFLHLLLLSNPQVFIHADLDRQSVPGGETPDEKLTSTFRKYLEMFNQSPTKESAIILHRILDLKKAWASELKLKEGKEREAIRAQNAAEEMGLDLKQAGTEAYLPPPDRKTLELDELLQSGRLSTPIPPLAASATAKLGMFPPPATTPSAPPATEAPSAPPPGSATLLGQYGSSGT